MTYEPNQPCRNGTALKNIYFFKYSKEGNGDWSDGDTAFKPINTRVVALDLNKPAVLKAGTVLGLAVWITGNELDFVRKHWTEITYEEAVERVGSLGICT